MLFFRFEGHPSPAYGDVPEPEFERRPALLDCTGVTDPAIRALLYTGRDRRRAWRDECSEEGRCELSAHVCHCPAA
jgi:hypothetical protein